MTKTDPHEGKNWPGYIFGGRMRTSTLALIVAFVGIGWLYETYEPPPQTPEQVPASEVVPPGFIPDPAYTWAPRTDVQRHTPTPTTTETTEAPSTSAPETTPTTPTTATSPTPPSGPSTPTTPPNVPPGVPTLTTPVSPQPAATSTSAAPAPPPATPVPSGAVRPG